MAFFGKREVYFSRIDAGPEASGLAKRRGCDTKTDSFHTFFVCFP